MKKIRLLVKLRQVFPEYTEKELFASILCGEALVNGAVIRDSKALIPLDAALDLRKKKYVSRGGFKLEKVLKLWDLPVREKIIIDAGSSTGGFTDCLLQNGASTVYAVDVGYNQLDYSLRTNTAVIVMEKTNIMSVESLDPKPDWAVADLSFRSLRSAASHILGLTVDSRLIALMKPQFELDDPDEDFDGIVRDHRQIMEICKKVILEMAQEGAFVQKVALSPVTGRKGNQELLFDVTGQRVQSFDPEKILSNLELDFLNRT
ncbi:TlyA family RNA methyltransferase [Oceanispirochaeta sp.]|jgi:23S rRNA (cytidine1920-2'-O)/16S rRNA (cytidine1409-2'-O)-methyltransferase|uniref:TlyA family RNA methyltransferase n=1 Tax=Oceanispirochaeta sp. TaxID=2035350 RepID=UPI002604FDED|nr:TlyA family RNA methyltransferase [Oceanispirochaeta sp.]MDA3958486.1 TlyA family RNA methyltransferase [Oceanispirochaeta sp.]